MVQRGRGEVSNVIRSLPGMFVSMVVNMSDGTIRFMQRVHSLNAVTIAVLVLFLVVFGVRVLHFVLEFIFRMRLKVNDIFRYCFFSNSSDLFIQATKELVHVLILNSPLLRIDSSHTKQGICSTDSE